MRVKITPGKCLQGQLGLAGITGMTCQCFHQALELFSSRAAGNWGEFCGDATSKPLEKLAVCGGGWSEHEVLLREGKSWTWRCLSVFLHKGWSPEARTGDTNCQEF